jgi:hypothetical protein
VQGDAGGLEAVDGGGGGLGADAGGQVEPDRGREPLAGGVERGRDHAEVGGQAHHLDRVHPGVPEPAGQRDPAGPASLEARVRRRELALVEDHLQQRPIQVGVQLDPAGADDAVRGPGLHVVRPGGEVRAGVDVVVPGRDHAVVRAGPQVRGDRRGDRGPAEDG